MSGIDQCVCCKGLHELGDTGPNRGGYNAHGGSAVSGSESDRQTVGSGGPAKHKHFFYSIHSRRLRGECTPCAGF